MTKRLFVLTMVFLLLCGGFVLAENNEEPEVLMPDEANYDWGRFLEDAQLEITEIPQEKVNQMDELSWRRLKALENLEAENIDEYAEELLEAIGNYEEGIIGELEKVDEETLEAILEKLEKSGEKKRERLTLLMEDETMPEQAREGARIAVQNQIRAEENRQNAFERASRAKANGEKPGDITEEGIETVPLKPETPVRERNLPVESDGIIEEPETGDGDNRELPFAPEPVR